MTSARALTVPVLDFDPTAVRHSPVCSADAATGDERVTLTVVGIVMVVVALVAAALVWRTVTDVPLTAVTMPRTALNLPAPAGGEKLGRGDGGTPPGRPKPAPPNAAQLPFTGSLTDTVEASRSPVESFCPVAVMQVPGVMSATTPVLVCVIDVLVVYVTVVSPFALLRISVVPLICTSCPAAPLRTNPPRPADDGDGDVVAPAAALPQAATASAATPVSVIGISLFIWTRLLHC